MPRRITGPNPASQDIGVREPQCGTVERYVQPYYTRSQKPTPPATLVDQLSRKDIQAPPTASNANPETDQAIPEYSNEPTASQLITESTPSDLASPQTSSSHLVAQQSPSMQLDPFDFEALCVDYNEAERGYDGQTPVSTNQPIIDPFIDRLPPLSDYPGPQHVQPGVYLNGVVLDSELFFLDYRSEGRSQNQIGSIEVEEERIRAKIEKSDLTGREEQIKFEMEHLGAMKRSSGNFGSFVGGSDLPLDHIMK